MPAGYAPCYDPGDIIRFNKQISDTEEVVHLLIEAVSIDLMGQSWYYVTELEGDRAYALECWTVDNCSMFKKVA